MKTNNKSNNL